MICPLIAYDAGGNIIASLDQMLAIDTAGNAVGLIDFEAHEAAGGKIRDIWDQAGAVGAATWPEWLGSAFHDFRVELAGKRVVALVHKTSGRRRDRAEVELKVFAAQKDANGVRDIRHLVGGPQRPLLLDEEGRTVGRSPAPSGTPKHLPVLGMQPKGRNR